MSRERDPEDLLPIVRATIRTYGMFAPGDRALVAVSGGTDSTAMVHALATMRSELGISLVAAHFHHGVRGTEADSDADYVRALCASLNVPVCVERTDVPSRRRRLHASLEEAARSARHAFLRRMATKAGASRIAVGHTRDDRAETVLLNVLRGAGLTGLAGFRPVDLPIVRPVYDASREQTQTYCARNALNPRFDSSNICLEHRRNRVRTELLPYLRTYYNPEVAASILRLADIARADDDYLDALASEARTRIACGVDNHSVRVPVGDLMDLPPPLRPRVLRQVLRDLRGDIRDVEFETLTRLLKSAPTGRGMSFTFRPGPRGAAVVQYARGQVTVRVTAPAAEKRAWQYTLKAPGRVEARRAGLTVVTTISRGRSAPRPAAGEYRFEFDAAVVTLPLTLRSWRPGDRIRPAGVSGTRKLQDIFTDLKMPVTRRHEVPLLVDAKGRVLAVIGVLTDVLEGDVSDADTILSVHAWPIRSNVACAIMAGSDPPYCAANEADPDV